MFCSLRRQSVAVKIGYHFKSALTVGGLSQDKWSTASGAVTEEQGQMSINRRRHRSHAPCISDYRYAQGVIDVAP